MCLLHSLSIVKKIVCSMCIMCILLQYLIMKLAKKMILKLLDSENFASNSFNVYLRTNFGTNYHVNCFWNLPNSLIDFWLLTSDLNLLSLFTFLHNWVWSANYRVITVAVWKSPLISLNAVIWCQIIFQGFVVS